MIQAFEALHLAAEADYVPVAETTIAMAEAIIMANARAGNKRAIVDMPAHIPTLYHAVIEILESAGYMIDESVGDNYTIEISWSK